jgi:uncharacterized protein YdaU (DUF1376 family)
MTTKTGVDIWFPVMVGEFLVETAIMSAEEVGAHVLFKAHAWRNNGALPCDEKRLRQLAKMLPEQWQVSRDTLLSFWIRDGDVYRRPEVDAEIAHALANRAQRVSAGKASAEKRALERGGNARSTDVATETERDANSSPSPSPSSGSIPAARPEPESPASSDSLRSLPSPAPAATTTANGAAVVAPRRSTSTGGSRRTVDTGDTWASYSTAYLNRYGTEPLRNAATNSKMMAFVKAVGSDAPAVASFYLQHNGKFYVQKMHPVGLLVSDAEKLHTEWRTNRMVTDTEARQVDRRQANGNAFGTLIAQVKDGTNG